MKIRNVALIALILTILIGADGIFMLVAHYQPSAQNNFGLSDGVTLVIGAGFMLIITIIAYVIGNRQSKGE